MRLWTALLLFTVVQAWRPSLRWPPRIQVLQSLLRRLTPHTRVILPGDRNYFNLTLMKNLDRTRLPGAIVLVKTKEDVRECILYARMKNLQVTIRSSGHCYLGRSTADYSLMIDVSQMKNIRVLPRDSRSDTGASAYVEAGNIWIDIYKEVDKFGLVAVGGYARTVSIAGFTIGGGHSPITPSHGLAVDQVLEFTIVVATGDIIKATATEIEVQYVNGRKEVKRNTDLFWAVMGGGSAFGVVTEFKIKLHPPAPSYVMFDGVVPLGIPGFPQRGKDFLRFYNRFVRFNQTEKWGGVMLVRNSDFPQRPGLFPNGSIVFQLLHFGGWGEAMRSFKPVIDVISPPGFPQAWQARNFSTYYQYAAAVQDEAYEFRYMINHLIQPDDLLNDDLNILLTDVLKRSSPGFLCAAVIIGGQAARNPDNTTSVNRYLRSAKYDLQCLVGWNKPTEKPYQMQNIQEFRERLYTIGKGTYYNEPDYYLSSWEEEYWGDKYPRLQRVKQCWDPDNFFRCHMCVDPGLDRCTESCRRRACGN